MPERVADLPTNTQIRLGRIVAIADENVETPGANCYVTTYTVKFINATFDPNDTTPELTLVSRSTSTTVTAIAPADMNPVDNQMVLVAWVGASWWIIQEYCDSVTYFPDQGCDPLDCAADYFPGYSGDCAEVPEFGWGVDFGTLGAACCGGNANGVVCLTNDTSGNEWTGATFDCGESDTAYWVLDTSAGTLKLKTVSGGATLVTYTLIAAEWCCMCANHMRLSCPADTCATNWPERICVKPNIEYCVGGDECDRSLYDFTVTASGFSGGCCTEYNATWVMSYQVGPGIWSSIAPANCDANQRFVALSTLLSNWQLSCQPAGPGADQVYYVASDLSCTSPTVFTYVTGGCSSYPATLTVYPSLA